MPYTLVIKKQAKKTLENLPKSDRHRITEKIMLLGNNPENPVLDIKKLQGEPCFRLRIGKWRVIFKKENVIKIVTIEKIKSRGDVYK